MLVLPALIGPAAPSVAVAENAGYSEPLAVTNTSPFVADRLLPVARSARVLPGVSADLYAGISSHFIKATAGGETLFVDGESNDLRFDLRYGITDRWDVGMGVPLRQQRDGFLDGVINDWHDFFNLPDGGRSQFPEGVLTYRYDGAAEQINFADESSSLGDIELSTQYVVSASEVLWVSVAAGVELDTGDPAELTGSGGNEGYVALRFSGEHLGNLPLVWHGQAGYSHADETLPLGAIAEQDLWFAGLGVDWQFAQNWSALVQLDAHTAPFESEIDALGDPAVMLSLAARWRFSERWFVEAGFTEDIAVETAPDVIFFSRLSYRP